MFLRPKIERDPNIQKLEQEVFAKMHEVIKPELQNSDQPLTDVQFVSFEDAIKELAQMNK